MMPRCCMAALTLAAMALGGCCEFGEELADEILGDMFEELVEDIGCEGVRASAGATFLWDVPDGMADPGTYLGMEVDWHLHSKSAGKQGSIFGWGFGMYGDVDDGAGSLFTGTFFWDLGRFIAASRQADPAAWIVCRPRLGFYTWSEAPQGGGWTTGLTLGLAVPFSRELNRARRTSQSLALEFGGDVLFNADGAGDAAAGKLKLAYTFHF